MRSPFRLGRLLGCLLLWSAVLVASSLAASEDHGGGLRGKASTVSVAAEFDAEDAIDVMSDFDAADGFPVWERPVISLAVEPRQTRAFNEPLGDGRLTTLVGIVVLHI